MPETLTFQIFFDGRWHDAATIELEDQQAGTRSPTVLGYEVGYCFADWHADALANGVETRDLHALSVNLPLTLDNYRRPTWPAFMLDLLPQGHARRRIAQELGVANPDDPRIDFTLLLRGAGSPIGNVRLKEAMLQEEGRVRNEPFDGLSMDEILDRTDRFADAADRFAMLASGSSGVQGEWPKLLLTKRPDNLWYPDSLVPDAEAREHIIVKLRRGSEVEDGLILETEAPYLEIARAFGLRAHRPLQHRNGILIIPRFDRVVQSAGTQPVIRYGQESIVSAAGVAEFGHVTHHENYVATIRKYCSEPNEEVAEYVLRDVLNIALGNPDNHGRNTALQKTPDGRTALTPVFDLSPMSIDQRAIARSTKWKCMNGRDFDPDWVVVADAVSTTPNEAKALKKLLRSKADFVRNLPTTAREHGVRDEVARRALARHAEVATALNKIRD